MPLLLFICTCLSRMGWAHSASHSNFYNSYQYHAFSQPCEEDLYYHVQIAFPHCSVATVGLEKFVLVYIGEGISSNGVGHFDYRSSHVSLPCLSGFT